LCNLSKLEFSWQISVKTPQYKSFTKIHPTGAELFHASGQMGRQDKANSCFHNFANAPKN
jgi:hypothetical protein